METASKGACVAVGDADGMLWMFRLRQCHATGLPAGRRSRQATWHHPSETIPKKARLALEGFESGDCVVESVAARGVEFGFSRELQRNRSGTCRHSAKVAMPGTLDSRIQIIRTGHFNTLVSQANVSSRLIDRLRGLAY